MKRSNLTNVRKKVAVMTGALLVFVLLASAFYLSVETGHTCSDEDCPICENILACANVLRQAGGAFVPHVIFMMILLLQVLVKDNILSTFSQESLVSKKVRMNN